MNQNKKVIFAVGFLILIIVIIIIINLTTRGAIQINSKPEKATISLTTIDKSYQTPYKIRLKTGVYQVTSTLDGYEPQQKEIKIIPGKTITVNFEMVKTPVIPKIIDKETPANILTSTVQSHFKIDVPSEKNGFDATISILATLNGSANPETDKIMLETYNQQLKEYKQEALDWIVSQGTNPKEIKIYWIPTEVKDL